VKVQLLAFLWEGKRKMREVRMQAGYFALINLLLSRRREKKKRGKEEKKGKIGGAHAAICPACFDIKEKRKKRGKG